MNTKLDNLSDLWAQHRADSLNTTQSLVYSTQSPGSNRSAPKTNKSTLGNSPTQSSAGVRVQRETKGRGGKAVTLIIGLALREDAFASLGKELKILCGSGGTTKDGIIEIQGDHVDRIVLALSAKGIKAKRSGA